MPNVVLLIPHAGMAPGVDRMIMLLTEEENIREVIAFPMNSNAQDLLLGSPGEVGITVPVQPAGHR